MAILYIETNLLIGIAKGQDPVAKTILNAVPHGSRLLIPSVCFMEAFSVFDFERRRLGKTLINFDRLIDDASRDKTSVFAGQLTQYLQAAKTASGSRFNDIQSRLYDVMRDLANRAERIDLNAEAFKAALDTPILTDPTDALILAIILEHAKGHPAIDKAFLSGNTKDFDSEDVKAQLQPLGVTFLKSPRAALGWLQSRPTVEAREELSEADDTPPLT